MIRFIGWITVIWLLFHFGVVQFIALFLMAMLAVVAGI